jgi:ubiquinone/menaquinone biosynthesis C-methylase UbiE
MTADGEDSRVFYETFRREDMESLTRPEWDATIAETVGGYLGTRQRVLDAGCGYGRMSGLLRDRGYQVVGMDLSESLLRSGRDSLAPGEKPRVPFVVGNMIQLPFKAGCFDAVVCLWSAFQEILGPLHQTAVLAGFHRVLDAGGLCLIEGRPPRAGDGGIPAARISQDTVKGLPYQQFVHDPESLRRRCAEAGIHDVEITLRQWGVRERMIAIFRKPR